MAEQDWKAYLVAKLTELFYIVLALAGVVIVFIAAENQLKYKDTSLGISDPVGRSLLAAFGMFVLLLGVYLRRSGASAEASAVDAKDYGIKILHPTAGTKTDKSAVSGVIKTGLPKDFSLWVFRDYNDKRFYPLRECTINGETWVAHDCDVGGKQGDVRWFSVNVVGPDGQLLISYAIEAAQYYKRVRNMLVATVGNDDVPYLPSLPKRTRDIVNCDSVRVERI